MKTLLLFLTYLICLSAAAQPAGEWTWMHGSSSATSPPGVFGTQGVTAPANRPPGLYEGCEWTDLQGNFWLFGGQTGTGKSAALWKFDPGINQWTWMKGPNTTDQFGIYGTQGISAPGNRPGSRGYGCVTWTDLSGDLWLFGGDGVDGYGGSGMLNDLWRYNIASNEWTWISGSMSNSSAGNYGTMGLSSSTNVPPPRAETSAGWCDNNNNLWLYGGLIGGSGAGAYGDLWKYSIATGEWTWMKGSSTLSTPANYGTQGVASPQNDPGGRQVFARWKDRSGNLWMFGGEAWGGNDLADLWKYDIATNQWTWINGSSTPEYTGIIPPVCDTVQPSQIPAGTETRSCWTDTCGNFWLYGGALFYSMNNLWCYRVDYNDWIFFGGAGVSYGLPVFGTMGVSSPLNKPGAKSGALSWRDLSGNFWLYGGGDGSSWGDLWRYVPDYSCLGACKKNDTISDPSEPVIPNVFSPDGNNINDLFMISASGYSGYDLHIYNRWGQEVFRSASARDFWNGRIFNSGNEVSDGTYYYLLRLNNPGRQEKVYKGFLTLVR